MTVKKKKTLTAVGAVAMAAVIALGGTFAWQSISQTALNEAAATLNPGGRLHDDFDGRNKDVYVENFTDVADGTPIFARVRLDEYMELGVDAGKDQDSSDRNVDVVVAGTKINDKTTWITRTPDDTDSPFAEYWEWTTGGQTTYMPTFNKNKDSLQADINGTYEGDGSGTPYNDYVDYSEPQYTETGITADATYDDDNNDADDENVRYEEETHIAKSTIDGTVITMDEWAERWEAYQEIPDPTEEDKAQVMGNFWVWDNDGWAYWANAIEPSTATGLLLDGIELVNPPSDNYYYGINVVGQFVTADDIGYLNGTGFYDTSAGTLPSGNAEALIELMTGQDIDITRIVFDRAPEGDICERGTSGNYFRAEVWKGNVELDTTGEDADGKLEWSIEGQLDEGTTIELWPTTYAELTVALDEPADEITVVATYTGADGETAEGRMTITLTDAAVNVSITPSSEDLVPPGETLTLTAEVTRSENTIDASSVTWSISGNTDPDTTLSTSTGEETTLTVGADEARGPFTVTASYYDEKRQETQTATYDVTADVPIPLSTELSNEIRDKNIENIGLDGDYSDYETVTIGDTWYVLAVDEENDRALLGWRGSTYQWFYETTRYVSYLWDATWANSDLRLDYAQRQLARNTTVEEAAVTTEIYTRNPGQYLSSSTITVWPTVNECAAEITDDWIITRDKMFLFTEADIRGDEAARHTTLDYTYNGKAIIPSAILKADADATYTQRIVLRSLASERACVSVYRQYLSDGVPTDETYNAIADG